MTKFLMAACDVLFLLCVGSVSAVAFESAWAAIVCMVLAVVYSGITYTFGFMQAKAIFRKEQP